MKKYAIVYSSKTGNTKKIAEAMAQVRPEDFDVLDAANKPDLSAYEFIAFGYGIDKGAPYKSCQEYMGTIKNKYVALFHTLGAKPKTEHSMACAANGGRCLGEGSKIINYFACQGAIDPKLIAMMRKMPKGSPHSATPENEERWAKAAVHPNETDCLEAKNFMAKTLGMFEAYYKK